MKKPSLLVGVALLALSSLAFAEDVDVSVDVAPYITATFSYDAISFGGVSVNTLNNPVYQVSPTVDPDYYDHVPGDMNVTVTTNMNYYIDMYAPSSFSGPSYYSISNLEVAFLTGQTTSLYGTLNEGVLMYTSVNPFMPNIASFTVTAPGTFYDYHAYRLDVPNILAGTYTATITITYHN